MAASIVIDIFGAILFSHRSEVMVNRILHGTMPGDLPVGFPTKLDLVINLRAARAIDLEIPRSLFSRGAEVVK
jgi:putative tryptophan/tyrosine transport system substrate-binding protein